MTELQAAVGKVQLTKLDIMLAENKKRYFILHEKISKVAHVRSEIHMHSGSYDTFIFCLQDPKLRNLVLDILQKLKFGTKNLPDAMEWHCSYFWEHALTKKNILNSKETYKILKKQIAIPIMLKRNLEEYQNLARTIFETLAN